jgi:glucans biosynthesis protein C
MGAEPPVRYHSLDALRGAMMLLGIYLHAAVAYSRYGNWPWKDGSTTGLFDVSLGLIHVFRMPVFYCIAGFFAALLLEQRGAAGFLRNRAARILLPFAAGWAGLFPLVTAIATTAMNLEDPAAIPGAYLRFYTSGEVLRHLDPMHLWFLEYLLIFYAIALAALPLARRLPAFAARVDRAFRSVVGSALGPLVLAAVTFPVLCLTQEGALDDPSGFIPKPNILAAYLGFFIFGWLLYRNQAFPRLRRATGFVGIGLATTLVGFYFIWRGGQPDAAHAQGWLLGSAWLLGLAMWLFTLGFTGLCFRLLDRPVPWIRYVSDSSYWLYLVHMPVLLAFQIVVAGTGWPPELKALVVLAVSVLALLASYHVLVRYTWIGMVLNGRRRPMTSGPRLGAAVGSGWPK